MHVVRLRFSLEAPNRRCWYERHLLLELSEFQLQPLLGILAFEPGILLHQHFQPLVQPRVLRLEQRGHLPLWAAAKRTTHLEFVRA